MSDIPNVFDPSGYGGPAGRFLGDLAKKVLAGEISADEFGRRVDDMLTKAGNKIAQAYQKKQKDQEQKQKEKEQQKRGSPPVSPGTGQSALSSLPTTSWHKPDSMIPSNPISTQQGPSNSNPSSLEVSRGSQIQSKWESSLTSSAQNPGKSSVSTPPGLSTPSRPSLSGKLDSVLTPPSRSPSRVDEDWPEDAELSPGGGKKRKGRSILASFLSGMMNEDVTTREDRGWGNVPSGDKFGRKAFSDALAGGRSIIGENAAARPALAANAGRHLISGTMGTQRFGEIGSHLSQSLSSAGMLLGGPAGVAMAGIGALGKAAFEAVDGLRKWAGGLHEANMKFSTFSGAMAGVQARQQVRDIYLEQERGGRRAATAEYLAKGKHGLEKTVAPIEDAFANMQNIIGGAFTRMLTAIIEPVLPYVKKFNEFMDWMMGAKTETEDVQNWVERSANSSQVFDKYGAPRRFGGNP